MFIKQTLALAAAAVVVLCSCRNSVKAQNPGTERTTTHAVLETTDATATPALETATDTAANYLTSKEFLYNSRFYDAKLLWEDGSFKFRDVYMSQGSDATKNLPVMDGDRWSGTSRKAGIYFVEMIPGIGLHTMQCKEPSQQDLNGRMQVKWADTYGYRRFEMEMDESTIQITGFDLDDGNPADNWFIGISTAREKSDLLPYTVIVPKQISSEYKGTHYDIILEQGNSAINPEDTPYAVFLYPENGTIKINLANGRM